MHHSVTERGKNAASQGSFHVSRIASLRVCQKHFLRILQIRFDNCSPPQHQGRQLVTPVLGSIVLFLAILGASNPDFNIMSFWQIREIVTV